MKRLLIAALLCAALAGCATTNSGSSGKAKDVQVGAQTEIRAGSHR